MTQPEDRLYQQLVQAGLESAGPSEDLRRRVLAAATATVQDSSQGIDSTVAQDPTQPAVRLVPDVPTELADGVSRGTHPIAQPPSRRHVPRRLVAMFQRKTVRWSVAAAIAAAVLGIVSLNTRSSFTLADVLSTVANQAWVHVMYDSGREQWTSTRDGRLFFKEESGRLVFADPKQGRRQDFQPDPRYTPNNVIFEQSIPPYDSPKTAWDLILGYYEKDLAASPASDRVEKHTETVGGRRLMRFDIYYSDPTGQRLLTSQIWADPQTRLPVQVNERLHANERQEQNREWRSGRFEFPATGPDNLYDLGVPANVGIVKRKESSTPDAQKIVEAGKQARNQFPDHYRAVVWPAIKGGEIDVTYRSGTMFRQSRYFNLGAEHKEYYLPLPAGVEQILQWTQTQVPVNIGLFDGKDAYMKSGPLPRMFDNASRATVRVARSDVLNKSNRPCDFQWSYFRTGLELTSDLSDLPPGCVVLRGELADHRWDCYIDPAHDYICVKETEWRQRSGAWVQDTANELSEFSRLPTGHWYARKRRQSSYDDPAKGTVASEQIWNIDIKLLEPDEYAQDTFDTKKLMDGATVETY